MFNFFSPSHVPNAEFADQGLVAPELEIITASALVRDSSNYAYRQTRAGVERNGSPDATEDEKRWWIYHNYDAVLDLIYTQGTRSAIDYLDTYLLQSQMTESQKEALFDLYDSSFTWALDTTWESGESGEDYIENTLVSMIYQIVSSPEYLVQR